ncbi:hypothetical protein [Mesorhizobium sp.]|uniref:hypothetical protein n=1 Tax=Mesorhizobium sp. TaxID=1871066 RepID=UPI000FEA18B0|nr:hypothetical protein [Mesorhizobium sp.]RWM84293.1 MAG: hypothetical protein EOR83_16860 [Mesorhizobium sp.]
MTTINMTAEKASEIRDDIASAIVTTVELIAEGVITPDESAVVFGDICATIEALGYARAYTLLSAKAAAVKEAA